MTRKLGWESKPDEEHLTKLLRSLLLGRMAMFDDPEVIAEAERRFDLHIKGQEQVPADFRSTVYKAVLRTGSRSSTRTCCKFIAKRRCTRKRIASPALWAPSKTKKSLKRFLSLSFSNRFLSNLQIFNCFRCWRLPCRTRCDRKTRSLSSRRWHRANSVANWPGTTSRTIGTCLTSALKAPSYWSGWSSLWRRSLHRKPIEIDNFFKVSKWIKLVSCKLN